MPSKKRPNLGQKLTRLSSRVARKEGGKSNAKVGDVKSVICHLADVAHQDRRTFKTLKQLGKHRAANKKK